MKVNPRATSERVVAKRITAPETKPDPNTGRNIVLLSYIDAGSYQQHCATTRELFLYAAGSSEIGEVSDGLDRLMHHQFIIHKNAKGKAVGLDIIPSRMYRSGVIPKSQEGVSTLIVRYDLDGAVARVTQRPFNVRFDQSAAVIQELDRIITSGKAITTAMRVGNIGRVVATTPNSVEIKLINGPAAAGPANQGNSSDDLQEESDEEVTS